MHCKHLETLKHAQRLSSLLVTGTFCLKSLSFWTACFCSAFIYLALSLSTWCCLKLLTLEPAPKRCKQLTAGRLCSPQPITGLSYTDWYDSFSHVCFLFSLIDPSV